MPPTRVEPVPFAQAVAGERYTGVAALYARGEGPPMTPGESLFEMQRRLEAERRRLEAQAQAYQSQQPGVFRLDQPGASLQTAGNFLADTGEAIGGWLTSPAPTIGAGGLDAQGRPQAAPLPPDVQKFKGPERPGYIQQPVMGRDGETVGYKYVRLQEAGAAADAAAAQAPNQPVPPESLLPANLQAQAAADPMARNFPMDRQAWNAAEQNQLRRGVMGTASPYDYGPTIEKVQKQAYGEPAGQVMQPDGTMTPTYNKPKFGFIGVTDEMAEMGWVHVKPIPKANPDWTPEERAQHLRLAKNAVVAPRYREGDHWRLGMNWSPKQVRNFQRAAKDAGLYEPEDIVIPGSMGPKDLEILYKAMGFSNQNGLDIEESMALAVQNHKRNVANRGGGGGAGDITRQVQIAYNTTSLAEGRTLLSQVLQDALGRSPTPDELRAFMRRLNGQEAQSPTKTITNYVRSGSTQTSTSRETPSSVDPAAIAREFALEVNGGEEAFDYAANEYLDGLMNMLIGAQNNG